MLIKNKSTIFEKVKGVTRFVIGASTRKNNLGFFVIKKVLNAVKILTDLETDNIIDGLSKYIKFLNSIIDFFAPPDTN